MVYCARDVKFIWGACSGVPSCTPFFVSNHTTNTQNLRVPYLPSCRARKSALGFPQSASGTCSRNTRGNTYSQMFLSFSPVSSGLPPFPTFIYICGVWLPSKEKLPTKRKNTWKVWRRRKKRDCTRWWPGCGSSTGWGEHNHQWMDTLIGHTSSAAGSGDNGNTQVLARLLPHGLDNEARQPASAAAWGSQQRHGHGRCTGTAYLICRTFKNMRLSATCRRKMLSVSWKRISSRRTRMVVSTGSYPKWPPIPRDLLGPCWLQVSTRGWIRVPIKFLP